MKGEDSNSIKQEQIHDLLFSREIGWQEIIYDLINTEQLDPWNINITILTDRYLEKIRSLEEADFFVSSKVLLAAALLLRIKSEILLNKYIKSIDEILFKDKDKGKVILEKGQMLSIDLDEYIPELIPKSPLPRFKRVTLQELMDSLNKAIITENRRIKKEIRNTNALRETEISLPKKKFSINDKIKEIYDGLVQHFTSNDKKTKIPFSEFAGAERENRIMAFYPLLHLDHQKKVWLQQDTHLEDFDIWLKDVYFKNNPDPFADLKQEVEEETEKLGKDEGKRLKKIKKDFENPLGEMTE